MSSKVGSKVILRPTPTVITRLPPKVGDTVYGMKGSSLSYWIKGKVLKVFPLASGSFEFEVEFTLNQNGQPFEDSSTSTSSSPALSVWMAEFGVRRQSKILGGSAIAYNRPCGFALPVGSRVIAIVKEELKGIADGKYFAGIVAEPPKRLNNNRYLIFFDDGSAQYVTPEHVFLVFDSSKEVWFDLHPTCQEFVEEYLKNYPDWPKVKLQKGTIISTEWNGNWSPARVIDVDDSLVKVHFENDNRYEWIYRGSRRFAPTFGSSEQGQGPKSNEVQEGQGEFSDNEHINYKPPGINTHTALIEYEGRLKQYTLPKVTKRPREFQPHECGPLCFPIHLQIDHFRKTISPLALPCFLGWEREVIRSPRRTIFYRAPCGRRMKDCLEVLEYLSQTCSEISIDHFCFDFSVECLSEFVPGTVVFSMDDLSEGKEATPVSVVNGLGNEFPQIMYTTSVLADPEVALRLDPDFMSCCECEDDCRDKEKCSCWRLTLEGAQRTNRGQDGIGLELGYDHNRRLFNSVPTGIYECNSRCRCKKTCSNRVVQNELKWRLQIFKTSTKGWAIRTLTDIPQGSFVCAYTGELMTEQKANQVGRLYGDQYLAELDYIEVSEHAKEGYEREAVEPHHYGITPRHLRLPTRKLFGDDGRSYIIDGNRCGNLSRFMNHSCQPNVFVQNVFVDTHDLRFPRVAFFTFKHVRAGSELTWDYNYEIGSKLDTKLYCYCGVPECSHRLL